MASKDFSSNILDLFVGSKENLTFCTYKELGLLCFDGKKLTLVSVLEPKTRQSIPVYVRTSTISFEQSPPGLDEVSALIPSKNGRFLALASERCVYIVEMSNDLWNNQSLFASVCLDNLNPKYTAPCDILNVNMLLSKRSSLIRKVVWHKNADSTEFSSYILGVLYANSIVKIYDANSSKSAPVALSDFQKILIGQQPNESDLSSDGTRLGFISEIVSFEFGPNLVYKGRTSFSVFALDSDGEIYYSVCGMGAENCVDAIGPLAFEGMDAKQKSFYFNSSEILSINCPNSSDFSVFAFCSEKGELFHAILYQTGQLEKLFESGKNIFNLKIMDSMQIEDWPLNNLNVSLQHNPDVVGEYLVVTSTEVYLINPLPWIRQLDLIMDDSQKASTELPPTSVRHFFKILSDGRETTQIVAISSLRIESEAREGTKLSLFSVLDNTPRVSSNFIQRCVTATEGSPGAVKYKRQLVNSEQFTANVRLNLNAPPFVSLPKLSTADLDHNQRLKAITQALKTINDQTKKLHPFVQDSCQKIEKMIERYMALDQYYEQYSDRLATIFEQFHKHKRALVIVREESSRLEDKHDHVLKSIQSKVYTPIEEEDKAVERLKENNGVAESVLNKLKKMNLQLIDQNSQRRTKSFQASASAQKFMLTKNAVEISQINTIVSQLKKDVADYISH